MKAVILQMPRHRRVAAWLATSTLKKQYLVNILRQDEEYGFSIYSEGADTQNSPICFASINEATTKGFYDLFAIEDIDRLDRVVL